MAVCTSCRRGLIRQVTCAIGDDMAQTGDVAVSVSLAEIARIAGVGRAAVSNWRRRHDDFPDPVGGSDASPLFSMADVELWLESNGKFHSRTPDLERLWPRFEALRDRDEMGRTVAAVGARLATHTAGTVVLPTDELPVARRDLVDAAIVAAERLGNTATFGFLLQRWLGTHVRQITTTPEPLAALMAEMAARSTGRVRTVLDPACGVGSLLLAAARTWRDEKQLRLMGQDVDPVLAAVAKAGLLLSEVPAVRRGDGVVVTAADTLRADAFPDVEADVVLCNPPSNDRDWGYAELATDPRWTFGQPPRTEPELAWVQHCVSALAPSGTAVLLLPPAVAARRAGRRVRSALLRTGTLRAVVALPPGAAFPYGLGLHLWLLGRSGEQQADTLTLVDAAEFRRQDGAGRADIEWAGLRDRIMSALSASSVEVPVPGSVRMPVMELLDEQVDLTPARYVPSSAVVTARKLGRTWSDFDAGMAELRQAAEALAALRPSRSAVEVPSVTVGDLERSGAVELHAGHALPEDRLRGGERPSDALAVLTIADLLVGEGARNWLPAAEIDAAGSASVVTRPRDVVIAVAPRAFDAWVEGAEACVLGPQLVAVRLDPALLDPWFLAACLRAPANARQAGTHASTASRIDVRRLQVPRLPLDAQRRYAEIHRGILRFEAALRRVGGTGEGLGRTLGEVLAAGRLPTE
jgi:SAM-dependent methyltransferase